MKKILIIILTLCMMLSLSACDLLLLAGGGTESNTTESPSDPYKVAFSSVKTYSCSLGVIHAQVIVEIENTGSSDLYLNYGACDLEDSEGNLIASKDMTPYPRIIAPGEKAFYYEEYSMDSLTEPIELKIIPRPQIAKSTSEHITYPVTDISITDFEYGGIKVLGRVENTSDSEGSMVRVAITLFDEASEPIGLVSTVLTGDLTPGEKVGFEATSLFLPDEITADSVASYTAIAYPYQFQFDFNSAL